MLTELHVKNLALIDEAEVSFGPGLNILTGETGAGKSILIGSINLALGHKMSRDMLRQGADAALVELIFQVEDPEILRRLKEMDVETEDGQLIITRKMTDGRSISRLNGETCTAARIREISGLLLEIHGQSEHQSLLYPDRQLEILDAYRKDHLETLLADTKDAFRKWQEVKKELARYQIDETEREREISFIRFEINEIEEAALAPGEDEELEKTYRRMTNSRKIAEAVSEVHRLCGYEDGAGDLTGRALREIGTVTAYDEQLAGLESMLADVDSLLNDINREAADYLDSFTFSEEEFYNTEKRLDLLNHLKSKYGRTIDDVLAYLEKQKASLLRKNRQVLYLNDKEVSAIDEYCSVFNVSSKASFLREAIMEKVLSGLDQNHPTLF
jgi:DNA repair protein RecN (Recombination protein N)